MMIITVVISVPRFCCQAHANFVLVLAHRLSRSHSVWFCIIGEVSWVKRNSFMGLIYGCMSLSMSNRVGNIPNSLNCEDACRNQFEWEHQAHAMKMCRQNSVRWVISLWNVSMTTTATVKLIQTISVFFLPLLRFGRRKKKWKISDFEGSKVPNHWIFVREQKKNWLPCDGCEAAKGQRHNPNQMHF